MRNVLILQGSEQTAKEGGRETEGRQRQEIKEPKSKNRPEMGQKQDLQLSCPVWVLLVITHCFMYQRLPPQLGQLTSKLKQKEEEEAMLNIFYLMIYTVQRTCSISMLNVFITASMWNSSRFNSGSLTCLN